MSRYDAYILRFWRSNGRDGPQWKCQIDHLGHDESAEFDKLDALMRHIQNLAGDDGSPSADPEVKGDVR